MDHITENHGQFKAINMLLSMFNIGAMSEKLISL